MLSWRYPAPYEIYNWSGADEEAAVEHLLGAELHYMAVLDERDEMIAFRCFGPDAQVPGGDYSEEALDLGGGLQPDLTGRGLGRHVIAAAMAYAMRRFQPACFRTTVASFNLRAKKTCERMGHRVVSTFTRESDGQRFDILMQKARAPVLSNRLAEWQPDFTTEARRHGTKTVSMQNDHGRH